MRTSSLVSFLLSLAALLLMCAGVASQDPGSRDPTIPTASEIQRLIKTKGARTVLADFYEDNAKWSALLTKISKGEQEWLEILIALAGVSDAGSASELEGVAAMVLASAPKPALEVLEPIFGLDTLCHNIMSVGGEFQAALRLIEERRLALNKVRDPKLAEKRQRCLEMLETLERDVRASKERGDML